LVSEARLAGLSFYINSVFIQGKAEMFRSMLFGWSGAGFKEISLSMSKKKYIADVEPQI